MSYGVNEESSLGFFGKANAVVADPKAQFVGLGLQLLDVALASLREPVESR